ncbi:MAG: hypothetical protein ABW221_18575 [Vicinamibacteria bacterium]
MERRDRLRALRPAMVWAVYVVASVWIFGQWLGLDARMRAPRPAMAIGGTTVPDMIHGTATKPFVLRTLVPSTVRVLREAIPDATARRLWLKVLRRCPRLARALPALEWEEQFLLEYLIAAVVMYGCLLGFVWALRALYRELHPESAWRRDLFPLAVLLGLPFFFDVGSHFLYDFATLLFSAWCLLPLERRRWPVFYAVFALSLFNKETAALVSIVFALRFFREMPRREWLAHLAAQVTLAAAVRAFLLHAYQANAGPGMQWNLRKNLILAGERGIDVPTAVLFGVLLVAAVVGWRAEPRLARAALATAPPLTLAYFLVGIYGEIRIFYELVPAAAVWVFGAVLGPRAPRDRVTAPSGVATAGWRACTPTAPR